MYAKSVDIHNFKCFSKASLRLRWPGQSVEGGAFENVNLVLGDNGGGKSSILRAVAIAVLAPALLESGFVPYRLVRRPRPDEAPVAFALLRVEALTEASDSVRDEVNSDGGKASRAATSRAATSRAGARGATRKLTMLARLERRGEGNLDRLHLDSTPDSPISMLLHNDTSPAFFVAGYGATRRVETGDWSEGSARKTRGLRYQRVAGLFEDHVALRPLHAWLGRQLLRAPDRASEAIALIDRVLPDTLRFSGARDPDDEQFLFDFEGVSTPFSALSDGYRAFVGWVSDLVGHLVDVAPPGVALDRIPGIVLVDEIDLHLHPQWQRVVVPMLATAFPRLQFVMTSHSPLVAGTVHRENVFVTQTAADGTATVTQLDERVFGRGVEQLLLSSYFGLQTTRPDGFRDEANVLFAKAAGGNVSAAIDYLDRLAGKPPRSTAARSSARGAKVTAATPRRRK